MPLLRVSSNVACHGMQCGFSLLITPRILEAIMATSCAFEGCFDFMSIAVLSTTVEMAFSPAARIVSPDSVGSSAPVEFSCERQSYRLDPQCHLRHLAHTLPRRFPRHT